MLFLKVHVKRCSVYAEMCKHCHMSFSGEKRKEHRAQVKLNLKWKHQITEFINVRCICCYVYEC